MASEYSPEWQLHCAQQPIATLVLAHGAGAGQDSDFIQYFAKQLPTFGINVVTFNFAYMVKSQALGKARPPGRADKLIGEYASVLEAVKDMPECQNHPIWIGGKSMGGRIATMLMADGADCAGGIALGYPFHPPGKPEKVRLAHFPDIRLPLTIVQGERDTFGNRDDIDSYALSPQIKVSLLTDGDHSFKPRKASGVTLEHNLAQARDLMVATIKGQA